MPAVDANSRALQQVEPVELLDGYNAWRTADALLDTGNEHLTCVDEAYAVGLGIFDPSARSGVHAKSTGTTTLRGIVPGAEAETATIHAKLRIRGVEFGPMRMAVTRLEERRPILVGMDVLSELFAAGFHITQ